jgi:hypothetical protein
MGLWVAPGRTRGRAEPALCTICCRKRGLAVAEGDHNDRAPERDHPTVMWLGSRRTAHAAGLDVLGLPQFRCNIDDPDLRGWKLPTILAALILTPLISFGISAGGCPNPYVKHSNSTIDFREWQGKSTQHQWRQHSTRGASTVRCTCHTNAPPPPHNPGVLRDDNELLSPMNQRLQVEMSFVASTGFVEQVVHGKTLRGGSATTTCRNSHRKHKPFLCLGCARAFRGSPSFLSSSRGG